MKKIFGIVLVLIFTLGTFLAFASPALANIEGLSPGFWKNHTEAWPSVYAPDDKINEVFTIDSSDPYYNKSLMEALRTNGNSDGKAAFWRQVVAQLLNCANADPDYTDWLKDMVNAVYPVGGEFDWDGGATSTPDTYGEDGWNLNDWKDYIEPYNQ